MANAESKTLRVVSSWALSAALKTRGGTDGTGNSREASSHSKQIHEIISAYLQNKTITAIQGF
jgi:pyridoxal biosynthesis lyase PdxS